jgi:hypothetical protein
MRRRKCYFAEEREPCGVTGLEPIHFRLALGAPGPDLSDVLVSRPKPHILIIWEPLLTKAPAPPQTQPHCCYLRTVIFYTYPHRRALAKKYWRNSVGKLRISTGGFEEWDKVEFRLGWDDLVGFEGERFEVGGGTVVWARRRWWMVHGARRVQADRAAA